jgi:hypothetical protein
MPAPENIAAPSVSSVTATTAMAAWAPPSTPNGIVLAYRLLLRVAGTSSWTVVSSGLILAAALGNLSAFTRYEVQVTAQTIGGLGFSLIESFETLESGEWPSGNLHRLAFLTRS